MQITQAELEIMNILWKTPDQGAAEIHEALASQKDWSIRTVKTLIARLVEKGAVTTSPDGRRYLYAPAISQARYRAGAARQFVDRVFSGRAAPLVAHLADSDGLTDDDIRELEQVLEDLKAGEKNHD